MRTDVLVIGAGPAGSSAAYYLAQKGVRVLLADRSEFPREKTCGGAIGPTGIRILNEMGVVKHAEKTGPRYRPFKGVRIFAPDGTSVCVPYPFERAVDETRPGWVMRRYELDEALKERAVSAGARFLPGYDASDPIWTSGRVVGFRGQYGDRSIAVDAAMVLVATGAHLRTVRALGLSGIPAEPAVALGGYYRLREASCLGFDLELHLDCDLLPLYGWVFPVDDRIANVGVGLAARGQRRAKGSPQAVLRRFIEQSPGTREKLAGSTPLGKPKGLPLRTHFPSCRTYVPGALVLGEAAGLVDPLAGEGITFALQSGKLAAEVAYEALLAGDVSGRRLATYDRALRRKFSTYFWFMSRVRSRLHDPKAVNALVAMAAQLVDAQTYGQRLHSLASILATWIGSWRSLGLTPYLVYRALLSRARSIEDCTAPLEHLGL